MIKEDYIEKTKAPRTPILISKSSNCMVFKLPCFRPKIPEEILLEDPSRGIITSMALYGKKAGSTSVSVTSTELNNTGIHYPMNSIVKIPNLHHNNKYCFAVAAYDTEENLSNQIGTTTQDIHSSQPLPINLLYCYLCKISFQMEEFGITLKAAKLGSEYLLEKSLIKERLLNNEFHPVFIYRINPDKLKKVSGIEMRAASETLLIWSYCCLFDPDRAKSEYTNANITRDRERDTLETCNLLLLSLELAIPCQAYDIARKVILEIYNCLENFFKMKTLSRLIFQILSKANICMSLIPTFYWDDLLRKVSGKLAYQTVRLSLQLNEFYFSKRVLYTEIKIPRRKYNLKASVEMVEVVENIKGKKPGAKQAAGAKKQELEEEEKKMVPQFNRDIVERNSYQSFFEEFLLTIHEDYYNFADYFQDYWNDHLNNLTDKLSSEEKINQSRQELNRIVEFYSLFFDIGNMRKKIEETAGKGERFLEYLTKLTRRNIESNTASIVADYSTQRKPDSTNDLVEQLIRLKHKAYEAKVDWNPAGLGSLIKEEAINQTGNREPIEIFTEYFEIQDKIVPVMQEDWRGFRSTHLWNSEMSILNATAAYLSFKKTLPPKRPTPSISHCDIFEMDINDRERGEKASENLNNDARSVTHSARSKTSRDLQFIIKSVNVETKELSEEQYEQLDRVFESLAQAAIEAMVCRAYRQLQNVAIYAYNIIVDEVLKPVEVAKRGSWKNLVLLVDCCLAMVEDMKKVKGFFDDDETNVFEKTRFNPDFFMVPRDDEKVLTPLEAYGGGKAFWFTQVPSLKISIIASLTGFVTQILMIKEKWDVLINITKTLSNSLSHYYSKYTLPFTICAQEVLINAATQKKEAKIEEKRLRKEKFDIWVKTKKEKSRQLRMSKEKTEEEVSYERDNEALSRQIELCKFTENMYKSDRDQALTIKREIDQNLNEPLKDLRALQRNLAQYAAAERVISEALRNKSLDEAEASKFNLQSDAITMIKAYKYLIDNSMRKKKETFLATVALHDLANLCFSTGDLKSAGMYWGECVDEVFKRSNSLKGFSDILKGSADTVQKYGLKELCIVIIVLGKLATITYHNDIVSKRECVLMACRIAFDILKVSLEHPQNFRDLATYSLSNLGEENLFEERKFLDPSELLHFGTQLSWIAVDFELYFRSLPLLCVCEYLSNHLCNSVFYSNRVKLLKSVGLSSCGLINESIINLLRVYYEKDLPYITSFKSSENLKLRAGANFSFMQDWGYQNDVTPNDSRNISVLHKVAALQLTDDVFFRLGAPNAQLFNFAKNSLVFGMIKMENLDIDSYIDLRRTKIEEIQASVIENIKRLYFEEKLMAISAGKEERDLRSLSKEEARAARKHRGFVESFLSNSPYSHVKDRYTSPLDSALSADEHRRDRISLIVMNYLLLSKSCLSLNSFSSYYSYMRDCLGSLIKLSNDSFILDFANLPEVDEGIEGKDDKKKKGAEKDTSKQAKDKKKTVVKPKKDKNKKDDDDEEYEEEEMDEEKVNSALVHMSEASERASYSTKTQRGVQAHLWLMVKYEIANGLYSMKRWTSFIEFVDILIEDCKKLNDEWYKRRCFELKARAVVILGQKQTANELYDTVVDIGEKNKEDDYFFGLFIADFGEFSYYQRDYQGALARFRTAKAILMKRLRNYMHEFDFNNINTLYTNGKVCSELLENKYDIEQKLGRERIEKGGKGGKAANDKGKKKDDKKGGSKDPSSLNNDIGTLYPMSHISTLKDQKVSLVTPDEQQDVPVNSSIEYVCIYAIELECYARVNQRIVHTLLTLNNIERNDANITARKEIFEGVIKEIKVLLDENMFILRKNYFINSSMKAVNETLSARMIKMEALFKFSKLQTEIIQSFPAGERPDYVKHILKRLPNKNFSLCKSIIEAPMFTHFIREEFLPLLDKSKDHNMRALAYLKGESLLHEFDFKVSDILRDVAETNLLMAEYRPRLTYRYVTNDDIRQYGLVKNHSTLLQDKDIFDKIQNEQKKDQELQAYLIWESFEYLKNSITATKILEKMREDYNRLADDSEDFIDSGKMNRDIREEIKEARRLLDSVSHNNLRKRRGRTSLLGPK